MNVTASQQRVATALLEAGAGDSIALVEGDIRVTYDELRQRIDDRLDGLALAPRSLVVLKAAPTIEFVQSLLCESP